MVSGNRSSLQPKSLSKWVKRNQQQKMVFNAFVFILNQFVWRARFDIDIVLVVCLLYCILFNGMFVTIDRCKGIRIFVEMWWHFLLVCLFLSFFLSFFWHNQFGQSFVCTILKFNALFEFQFEIFSIYMKPINIFQWKEVSDLIIFVTLYKQTPKMHSSKFVHSERTHECCVLLAHLFANCIFVASDS